MGGLLFGYVGDWNPSKCRCPVDICCNQFKNWLLHLYSSFAKERRICNSNSSHSSIGFNHIHPNVVFLCFNDWSEINMMSASCKQYIITLPKEVPPEGGISFGYYLLCADTLAHTVSVYPDKDAFPPAISISSRSELISFG